VKGTKSDSLMKFPKLNLIVGGDAFNVTKTGNTIRKTLNGLYAKVGNLHSSIRNMKFANLLLGVAEGKENNESLKYFYGSIMPILEKWTNEGIFLQKNGKPQFFLVDIDFVGDMKYLMALFGLSSFKGKWCFSCLQEDMEDMFRRKKGRNVGDFKESMIFKFNDAYRAHYDILHCKLALLKHLKRALTARAVKIERYSAMISLYNRLKGTKDKRFLDLLDSTKSSQSKVEILNNF